MAPQAGPQYDLTQKTTYYQIHLLSQVKKEETNQPSQHGTLHFSHFFSMLTTLYGNFSPFFKPSSALIITFRIPAKKNTYSIFPFYRDKAKHSSLLSHLSRSFAASSCLSFYFSVILLSKPSIQLARQSRA